MKPFSIPDIRELIADLIPEGAYVRTVKPGGDVDTAALGISFPNTGNHDEIFVRGFRADGNYYGENRGEETPVDAEMIELRNRNSDSRGGIDTDFEPLAVTAAKIRVRLKQNGWEVVHTLDGYF